MKNKLFTKRIKAFFILAAIVSVIFFKILQVISVDILMDDIHKLEEERKKLFSETELLRTKISKLSNIDKITKDAVRQLGLITNGDKIYFLKIAEYKDLESVKKNFARRYQQNRKKYNLAGVH